MATTTTNYSLTKPAGTDKYDISVFNNNADKIDAQMKANANAAATAKSTADSAKSTADAAVPKAGGTMTGKLVAQSNTAYTTKQVRNIVLSTTEPTISEGGNGDLWVVYE